MVKHYLNEVLTGRYISRLRLSGRTRALPVEFVEALQTYAEWFVALPPQYVPLGRTRPAHYGPTLTAMMLEGNIKLLNINLTILGFPD